MKVFGSCLILSSLVVIVLFIRSFSLTAKVEFLVVHIVVVFLVVGVEVEGVAEVAEMVVVIVIIVEEGAAGQGGAIDLRVVIITLVPSQP